MHDPNLNLKDANAKNLDLEASMANTRSKSAQIVDNLNALSAEIDQLIGIVGKAEEDPFGLAGELQRVMALCQTGIDAEALIS